MGEKSAAVVTPRLGASFRSPRSQPLRRCLGAMLYLSIALSCFHRVPVRPAGVPEQVPWLQVSDYHGCWILCDPPEAFPAFEVHCRVLGSRSVMESTRQSMEHSLTQTSEPHIGTMRT
jgi:hypothetical protein